MWTLLKLQSSVRAEIITFQQNAHVLPSHPFNVQSPKFCMYSFEKMRMSKPIRIVLLVNNNFLNQKRMQHKKGKKSPVWYWKKECKIIEHVLNVKWAFRFWCMAKMVIRSKNVSIPINDKTLQIKRLFFFHSLWLFNKIVRDEAFCINDKMNNGSALQQSMHV